MPPQMQQLLAQIAALPQDQQAAAVAQICATTGLPQEALLGFLAHMAGGAGGGMGAGAHQPSAVRIELTAEQAAAVESIMATGQAMGSPKGGSVSVGQQLGKSLTLKEIRGNENVAEAVLDSLQNTSGQNAAVLSIRTELNDKHAQIQQLIHQFERLKRQLEAERMVQRRALEQCEEYKATVRDKDNQIVLLRQAVDSNRLVETKIITLQTECDDLRASNLQLEKHLQSMLSTTKLLDSDEKSRISSVVAHYADNIDTLNKQLLDRDKKIDGLQDQMAQLNAVNSSLRLDLSAAQSAQQSLNSQLTAATQHALQLEAKLTLYSSDSGVDSEELMAALQMVRRKKEIGYNEDPKMRIDQEAELKQREAARNLQYNFELLAVQKKINEKQSNELQRCKAELSRLRTEIAIIKQASVRPPKRTAEELALLKERGIELRNETDTDERPFNLINVKKDDEISLTSESMFSQSNLDLDSQFSPAGKGEMIAFYLSKALLDPDSIALKHPYEPNAEPITFVTVDFFTFDSTTSTLGMNFIRSIGITSWWLESCVQISVSI